MDGACDAAAVAKGNDGHSKNLRVRVRVPVAAEEEMLLPPMATASGEGGRHAPDTEVQLRNLTPL